MAAWSARGEGVNGVIECRRGLMGVAQVGDSPIHIKQDLSE